MSEKHFIKSLRKALSDFSLSAEYGRDLEMYVRKINMLRKYRCIGVADEIEWKKTRKMMGDRRGRGWLSHSINNSTGGTRADICKAHILSALRDVEPTQIMREQSSREPWRGYYIIMTNEFVGLDVANLTEILKLKALLQHLLRPKKKKKPVKLDKVVKDIVKDSLIYINRKLKALEKKVDDGLKNAKTKRDALWDALKKESAKWKRLKGINFSLASGGIVFTVPNGKNLVWMWPGLRAQLDFKIYDTFYVGLYGGFCPIPSDRGNYGEGGVKLIWKPHKYVSLFAGGGATWEAVNLGSGANRQGHSFHFNLGARVYPLMWIKHSFFQTWRFFFEVELRPGWRTTEALKNPYTGDYTFNGQFQAVFLLGVEW